MNYKQYLKTIGVFFLPAMAAAQMQADSTSLLYAFRKGTTEGHFRMFYMATNNKNPLTDYNALAAGGGLKYETARFKGFQLGIGGYFIWNLASSDLSKPDSITQSYNRYEMGQFDQTNPANKKNLQRLEDFFLTYHYKKSTIRFGKQVIKTPFINPQDGRMRPTGVQGLWVTINELKKTKVETGWITHVSPRGTVNWYRGAGSIGIYPSGVATDGRKSNYLGQLHSNGTAIIGITHKFSDYIQLQLWNYWVENIFNTTFFQADAGHTVDKQHKWLAGIQITHQQAVHHGGNADAARTYFDPAQKPTVLSARVGYKQFNSMVRLNFTRITKHGRFLFPREWGREPFFTFLPRERNEGLGDVYAVSLNLVHDFLNNRLNTEASLGYYDVANVRNARLNKYGFPSYVHVHFSAKYTFDSFMKGLTTELLYLYKIRTGNTYNDWKYTINKVDMQQWNFIFNFQF